MNVSALEAPILSNVVPMFKFTVEEHCESN